MNELNHEGLPSEDMGMETEEVYSDEAAIKAGLESKRLGFDEISIIASEQLIQQAPENETFTVPDEMHQAAYEERARALDREDLKFLIEE